MKEETYKQLIDFYDRRYFNNLELMLSEPGYRHVKKIISAVARNRYTLKKVIDIGCGTGWLLEILKDSGCNRFGIDVSGHGIKKTKALLRDANLLCSDCQHLPFRDDYFDFVFSTWLLEHITCPIRALKEMHRILKRGGTAIIMAPTPELRFVKRRDSPKLKFYRRRGDEHLFDFSPLGLEDLIAKAGLTVKERRGIYRPGALNVLTFPIFKTVHKGAPAGKLLSSISMGPFHIFYFLLRFFPNHVRFRFFFNLEMMLSNKIPFNLFGIETVYMCSK